MIRYICFYEKSEDGKPYFVYMTATANKFLRVYYGKVNEYLDSIEEKQKEKQVRNEG